MLKYETFDSLATGGFRNNTADNDYSNCKKSNTHANSPYPPPPPPKEGEKKGKGRVTGGFNIQFYCFSLA